MVKRVNEFHPEPFFQWQLPIRSMPTVSAPPLVLPGGERHLQQKGKNGKIREKVINSHDFPTILVTCTES